MTDWWRETWVAPFWHDTHAWLWDPPSCLWVCACGARATVIVPQGIEPRRMVPRPPSEFPPCRELVG